MTVAKATPPIFQPLQRLGSKFSGPVMQLGHVVDFAGRAIAGIPLVLRSYRKEFTRLLSDVAWGNGSLVVGGGTAGVALVLGIVVGVMVGIEGYNFLQLLGLGPAVGIISSLVNTRELAPIACALAFSTQSGCRFTAQLGAMRISEEIDALEVMAINSMSYLVSTRLIGGVIAIIPLYSVAVLMSFLASRFYTIFINGQSAGVYDHYFSTFLRPSDLVWSFAQAILMGLVVMGIHCYHGYNAAGGPAGVGVAVGRAVRSSLIAVVIVCLLVSLAIYGTSGNLNLAG